MHTFTRGLQQRARGTPLALAVALVLNVVVAPALYASGGPDRALGVRADRAVMARGLAEALYAAHRNIPAFSRQTKLACSACHYQFPALTPFGRLFKLNGYTLTGLQSISAPRDTMGNESLRLAPIPPAAAMFIASDTRTNRQPPGTQNNTTQFPEQASLFLAGQVTPNVGAFTQFTYSGTDGSFGIDNIDIRYAQHHEIDNHDLLFGLTLNNNPGVQDVWNTMPAWGYPFISSSVAPGPIASTLLEGSLAQQVIGLGAYTLWNNQFFAEATAYHSSPQGGSKPLDSTATNATRTVAPYWRLAYQKQMASNYLMIGTFGLNAQLYPTGVAGPTNHFNDVGVDAQWEHPAGQGAVIGRASWIYESQERKADIAASPPTAAAEDNHLSTFKANVSVATSQLLGFSLGYFQTVGSTDAILYQPAAVGGSSTGSPNTQGYIGEVSFNAWQNTRIGLQYVGYMKFNGASSGYDGFGRSATDNNTLYTYFWVVF